MTFLEIVQQIAQEVDAGTSPTAVVDQTGEALRYVTWAKSAYRDICKKYDEWAFLRSSFTVTTSSGDNAYAIADCTDTGPLAALMTLAGFNRWWEKTFRIYSQASGVSTQGWIPYRAWQRFYDTWLIGAPANAFPSCFTIRPYDKALVLGATPDAAYVLTGEYQRTAPELAADGDVPLFPARFHELVVWQAIIRNAGFEEDSGLYQHAATEANRLMGDLELAELPQIRIGGGSRIA